MSAKSDEDEATAVAALSARWQERWPACRPIGHELRDTAPSTWVRFHSLPESKRYAEDEDEYRVLLDRHNTVIGELVADSHDDALLVISCAWSDGPVPVPRHDDLARLAPSSVYWTSLLIDDHWTHLFAGTAAWRTGVLDGLLR